MTKIDKAIIKIAREMAKLNLETEKDLERFRLCYIGLKEMVANIASPGDCIPITQQDKAVIKAAFKFIKRYSRCGYDLQYLDSSDVDELENTTKDHPNWMEEWLKQDQ